MPRYVFKCPTCHTEREEQRTIAERDSPMMCQYWDQGCTSMMQRQITAPVTINVKGFAAVNGYSRTDTGYQPSAFAGIKTRVSDAGPEKS